MAYDASFASISRYVDLDTPLARLRRVQDPLTQVGDSASRASLETAYQFMERTQTRLFVRIDNVEPLGKHT
jgi:hypothetical protein